MIEHEVGASGLAPHMQLAADDDAALGERDLLAHLPLGVPPCVSQGRHDQLGADITFRE